MSQRPTLDELAGHDDFVRRHIGTPTPTEQAELLDVLGLPSLDALLDEAVPASIRQRDAAGPAAGSHRGRGAGRACGRSPAATRCSRR